MACSPNGPSHESSSAVSRAQCGPDNRQSGAVELSRDIVLLPRLIRHVATAEVPSDDSVACHDWIGTTGASPCFLRMSISAAMPNHLARETSPYLLQHKDNPVEWYPWGEEAIQKARAEQKPI